MNKILFYISAFIFLFSCEAFLIFIYLQTIKEISGLAAWGLISFSIATAIYSGIVACHIEKKLPKGKRKE